MLNRDDDEIILCGDCSYRAVGTVRTVPTSDDPFECEWCKSSVESAVNVVPEQDDPGPMKWQRDRDLLTVWLKVNEHIDGVDVVNNKTIDFTVGSIDEWPSYLDDDELNAVRSSSINVGFVIDNDAVFESGTIHCPPASESLQDEISAGLSLPESFAIHYGTTALSGVTPAPDGVVTPHIEITSRVSLKTLMEVLEQVVAVYVDVYDAGDAVLRSTP